MNWAHLLNITKHEAVFSANMLIAGCTSPALVAKQLCQWVKAGKLLQIRRGWYSVAEPYRNTPLHNFHIATLIKSASYVSLQSALHYYNLIPDYVPVTTCVTTGRPERIKNPTFPILYKHIKPELFFGYSEINIAQDQRAFIASPEKALLDLVYLTPGADNLDFIKELRLEHLDYLNSETLEQLAVQFGGRKIKKTVKLILNQKIEDEDYVEI